MQNLHKPHIGLPINEFARNIGVRILIAIVFILLTLPFWIIFQDVLTRGVMSVGWYRQIQEVIVPYELRVIGTILASFHLPVSVGNAYIEWPLQKGQNEVIYLIWNCVGWQTLILFIITLMTGLAGKHSLISKIEVLLIGILGTYLLNIFRLVLVILVYMEVGRTLGRVFHDYFSSLLTLSWLFFFWWFSYKFILEEKR
ncbi:MAG: exosortase/archaeosortase family protein [Patescibacteria group bacterium]